MDIADAPQPVAGAGLLTGKRLVITGVATCNSIAFEVARTAQLAGAELVLTSFGRVRRLTERSARRPLMEAGLYAEFVNPVTSNGYTATFALLRSRQAVS